MQAILDDNQINLTFRYDPAVVDFVRRLPGRQFHKAGRYWSLPVAGTSEVNLRNLEKLGFSVESRIFDALKRDLSLRDDLARLETRPDAPLPTSLPLYPFQRVASAWMAKAGGGINAYPVGTGKTLMALAAWEALKVRRALVIAPKSLLYQWQQEIAKWLPALRVVVADGPKAKRLELYREPHEVLILNYELCRIDFDSLPSTWDVIVCDEAHRLGTMWTKTRKAVKQLRAKHRFALTATPLMNHPAELYGIVDWCFPGALGSYKDFLERFTLRNQWGGILRAVNLDELRQKVRRYLIRKELSELAVELPPMTIEDIPFDLSAKERKLYSQLQQEILLDIDRALIAKVENPVLIQMTLVKMLRLMELTDSMELLGADTSSSKLTVLRERLADVAVNGNKVIIFSRFTRMVDILKRELVEYNPLVITGNIAGKARAEAVRAFGADDTHRVLIASDAGGEGLNLEMANIIFHYDLPYSYGKYVQRNGRIMRLTQKKPMVVYNLIARKSMDEKIARIIARKEDLFNLLLGGGVRDFLLQ